MTRLVLPSGLTAPGSSWLATFTEPTLAVGASSTYTVSVTGVARGSWLVVGRVTSESVDPNTSNNRAVASIVVG